MKNGFWTRLAFITGLVTSIAAVGTLGYKLDARYAKAASLHLTAMRLDQKILQDKIDWIENKLQALHDKYGPEYNMPEDVKAWYRNLKRQLRNARDQLKRINKER